MSSVKNDPRGSCKLSVLSTEGPGETKLSNFIKLQQGLVQLVTCRFVATCGKPLPADNKSEKYTNYHAPCQLCGNDQRLRSGFNFRLPTVWDVLFSVYEISMPTTSLLTTCNRRVAEGVVIVISQPKF